MKKTAAFVLTASVTFGVIRLFGVRITKSAGAYLFGNCRNAANEEIYGISDTEAEDTSASAAADKAPPHATKAVSGDTGAVAVDLAAISGRYKVYGGTSVINNTGYDISSLLYAEYTRPVLNREEPYILIYHTHTSESYCGGGTVVDVGGAMADEFERLGYKTVHLTEVYDKEQFSGAYSRSVVGVKEALEKNPSIRLCFDVHRDSITGSNGVEYRTLTEIDGKSCAQVMLVCGTDEKGLDHPNWRENFKFALDVSRTMTAEYGSLSRPVNLRGDRFNTHVTPFTLLMEVGSDANTLDEAVRASVLTARAVVGTIESGK